MAGETSTNYYQDYQQNFEEFEEPNPPYGKDLLSKVPLVNFSLANANKSDVTYFLYKNSSQENPIIINGGDKVIYSLPQNERELPLKVLMHGYTSNVTSPWYQPLKAAYFDKGPHNVILIDWSPAGSKAFKISGANVNPVGEFIADFIINLKVPLNKVHLIGHSLGSHLAGFIGKHILRKTGKRINRITATDPGGPGFERAGPESKLTKDDAEFVDAIHTDMGYFGATRPMGHVDFYVNGGKDQPGCESHMIDENCSHARSNYYFIESVNKRNIMAKAAEFNKEGEVVVVNNNRDKVVFGDSVPETVRGIYYLKTNPSPPFLVDI